MNWDLTPTAANRPVDLVATVQRHPKWGHLDHTYKERPLSVVDTILVHHAASSPAATPADIARWHVEERGWPGPGYHLFIDSAGTAFKLNKDSWRCFHAFNDNWNAIGICLAGNFTAGRIPTAPQLVTLYREICRYAQAYQVRYLGGHRQGRDPRNHTTACPGDGLLPAVEMIRRHLQLQPVPHGG